MIAFIRMGDSFPADVAISKDERDALLVASMPKFSTLVVRVMGLTQHDGLGYAIAYNNPAGTLVPLARPIGPIAFRQSSVTGWQRS